MRCYSTNPQVIHETIDGETIIIDLGSGTYFSLRGVAPEIWNGLAEGRSDEQIVAALEARYAADDVELGSVVSAFLADLAADQLIAPSDDSPPANLPDPPPAAERAQFAAPKLERYTDMQEIILLDPVHKVDSQGWPRPAPSVPESA